MISKRSKNFKKLYDELPEDAQRQALTAYHLFKQNPNHPSLGFKPVLTAGVNAWSVKVGEHYRAIGYRAKDVIAWDWIGPHEVYTRLIKQRR